MRIIFGSQFNGTHNILRIVNGCLSGKKKKTFSKFLATPYKERGKHVRYLIYLVDEKIQN